MKGHLSFKLHLRSREEGDKPMIFVLIYCLLGLLFVIYSHYRGSGPEIRLVDVFWSILLWPIFLVLVIHSYKQ